MASTFVCALLFLLFGDWRDTLPNFNHAVDNRQYIAGNPCVRLFSSLKFSFHIWLLDVSCLKIGQMKCKLNCKCMVVLQKLWGCLRNGSVLLDEPLPQNCNFGVSWYFWPFLDFFSIYTCWGVHWWSSWQLKFAFVKFRPKRVSGTPTLQNLAYFDIQNLSLYKKLDLACMRSSLCSCAIIFFIWPSCPKIAILGFLGYFWTIFYLSMLATSRGCSNVIFMPNGHFLLCEHINFAAKILGFLSRILVKNIFDDFLGF